MPSLSTDFEFDVFLSHSANDKAIVRRIAAQMRTDGVRVWFDEWEIKPGDNIMAKVEAGLERSRVLVLCMSVNAFGSDWAQLEAGTFRFRDPLNKERRFIPLRLDSTPIKGSLAQFLYINWTWKERKREYAKLLQACRPAPTEELPSRDEIRFTKVQLDLRLQNDSYAFSPDRRYLLSGSSDETIRMWNVQNGQCLQKFGGRAGIIKSLAWSIDQRRFLSGSDDYKIRLWDVAAGGCLQELGGHRGPITALAWSGDQRLVLSGSTEKNMLLWDLKTGKVIREFESQSLVRSIVWSADQECALTGSDDGKVKLWNIKNGQCLQSLAGHNAGVCDVAWNANRSRVLSGSKDNTILLWDVEKERCLHVFEGHTDTIKSVMWSADQRRAISGALDMTIRLWDVDSGRCLHIRRGHTQGVCNVAWSTDEQFVFSVDTGANIGIWNVSAPTVEPATSRATLREAPSAPAQVQYTNAKVLLVGESGVGKTGLSKVLTGEKWQPSDSTVGAWATQWKLPVSSGDGIEREIWLWDFGGQADQRLIHQLYMDETALAALVFDGQKEDVFETLGQWDRDLTRASNNDFAKLLVAGRVDAGGLRVSRSQVEAFAKERGFAEIIETSAKFGTGCVELRQAILNSINWEDIPWRSSPVLFKQLKEEIVRLKDEGRVLLRFNELRETLQLRLSNKTAQFTDDELKAVVRLLGGPGVVWELKFGSWVLLQPERINAYAQAVIQTMREDEHERGCITEERVLKGELTYRSSTPRLETNDERFILLAMHQTLLERGLCLREHTEHGPLLIFPSFYRRERPELIGHPAVLVSYRFNGFLDDIYATLVVRLHHTSPFSQDQLWRYAADFRTLTKKQLGVKLTRRSEGAGELDVYFDPMIPMEEIIIFSKYVHEHLLQNAKNVLRLRHYVCPHCFTPVGNSEVARNKLNEGKKDIVCVNCEKRVPLWDQLEELFASSEMQLRVRELQMQSAIVLDSESRERALVGEVISTVALAGQICREFTVSDHGIDMEIEFKSDAGQATGRKVYLQLKSGDSHLSKRKSDGAEIFRIDKARHANYWREQAFPVLLVIRTSDGKIRWMDIRHYLQRESNHGSKPVEQIVFAGQRFDVMSVRHWRETPVASASS